MDKTIDTVLYRGLVIEIKELTTGEYEAIVKRFNGYDSSVVVQSDSYYNMVHAVDHAKSLLDDYLDDEIDY